MITPRAARFEHFTFGRFFLATPLFLAVLTCLSATAQAQQATVTYDLNNVMLLPDITDPNVGAQQMTGRFVWTYTIGDFENGSGDFSDLYIPFSGTSLGRLDTTIETKSLEFTLQGNYHDRGVDVTIKLLSPFSETLSAPVDAVLSMWQIEVGTITAGHIVSGDIVPTCWSPLNYGTGSPGSGGFVPTIAASGGEPRIGNDAFQIDGAQVLGGSTGILLLGFGQTQLPVLAIDVLVDPVGWILTSQVASGTPGVAGAGTLQYAAPVPDDMSLIGIEVDLQIVAIDSGAPQGFLAASDGLTMNLCVK